MREGVNFGDMIFKEQILPITTEGNVIFFGVLRIFFCNHWTTTQPPLFVIEIKNIKGFFPRFYPYGDSNPVGPYPNTNIYLM